MLFGNPKSGKVIKMGWLDNWWTQDDPLKDLDLELRDYLRKETQKPSSSGAQSTVADARSYREQLGISAASKGNPYQPQPPTQEAPELKDEERPLPSASLFQDGRYKDLWKTYKPQREIEEAGKSDEEKLLDIVGAFKEVQASVGRAAMENCADEQFAIHDCFRSGSWSARMTMCKAENRRLTRCINMQKRFLRALGFASINARPDDESERIQMHADRLYQRMLKHEELTEKAKKEGTPTPVLPSLDESLPDDIRAKVDNPDHRIEIDKLPKQLQEALHERHFKDLEGEELQMARRGLQHRLSQEAELMVRITERYQIDHENRVKRRAEGRETFDDKIFRVFDMRDYSGKPREPKKREE